MNTPSHLVINLALLSQTLAPNTLWAISVGAILPDVPIFIFYAVAKGIYQLPEKQIWTEAYYQSMVQFWVALGHSFPLAIVGLVVSLYWRSGLGITFFASIIGHFLLDIPVHNDDAHRHFFPVSDFRFISPLSYWDVRHHARWVAAGEFLSVLALTPLVWQRSDNLYLRGGLVLLNAGYLLIYPGFWR